MTASAPGVLSAATSPRTGGETSYRRPPGHRRARRRRRQGPLALAVSIAVAATGLGACGAGRDILGTNTGPCFLTLPVAKRAVEGRGTLAGVRRIDVTKLATPSDRAVRDLIDLLPVPPPHDICLVAYTGSFTSGQVDQPVGPLPPGTAGRYAIAVVAAAEPRLLGTFIVRRLPLNFSRAHVGF